MNRRTSSQQVRFVALVSVIALLLVGATLPARAQPTAPTRLDVDLASAAGLAPDGQSVQLSVLARCPERWTVVEASVAVSQADASGEASFPLTCTGLYRTFSVTVQSSDASFRLGQAEASAVVAVERGRTARVQDSQQVRVDPIVLVALADTALLEGAGEAVLIDVTVACPVGADGQQSSLVVSQGQTLGGGSYVPVCDGQRHTFGVRAQASQALFQPGGAEALTFALVDVGGEAFYGVGDRLIKIVSSAPAP